MSGLLTSLRRTLREHALLQPGERALVGCSGGPDSQALLHALHLLSAEHGYTLIATSVNHGLRADAAHDVAVAARLASRLDIEFHTLNVTVEPGASLQAQARRARYAALFALSAELSASRVVVAHTRDDQAETVLARLLRGTGVAGLTGITLARPDGLVRPLLYTARAAVRAYVSEYGIEHVVDPSNRDPRFLRARLRHVVLPALEAENPRLTEHLAALAEDAAGAATLLAWHADALIARCAGSVSPLRSEAPFVQRLVLQRWAQSLGVSASRRQLEALCQLLVTPGEVRVAGDRSLRVDASGRLFLDHSAKRGAGRGRQPSHGSARASGRASEDSTGGGPSS